MLGVTASVLFIPFHGYYSEDGPTRRVPCGSVVHPGPGASRSEGCVDELDGARYFAYMTGGLSALLIIGVAATSPSVRGHFTRRQHGDPNPASSAASVKT